MQTPDITGHVLFVNPPSERALYRGIVCTWVSKARYLWQPFDFILLSALVKPPMRVSYKDSFLHNVDMRDIIRFARDEQVTYIVMAMSSIEWESDKAALLSLRNELPKVNIAVLGDIFQERCFVKQVLPLGVTIIRHPLDLKIAEYFSSGNTRAPALLCGLNTEEKRLPPVNIPRSVEFPLPRHEVFLNTRHRSPFDKYRHSAIVNITWGCPFSCSYCSWSSPYLPFVHKSAASVIKELETLNRRGVREIFFSDLSFGFPGDIVREVIEAMLQNNWRFSWHCYIKSGSLSEDFLRAMRKSGCHTVITGVESSNLNLSRYNRNVSLEDIRKTIALCHSLGIDICGDFILGLNDSSDNWRELAQFAIDLNLDFASFNIYTPLLGSLERYRKIEEGTIKEGECGFDTTGCKRSLVEHSENRSKCVRKFYGRPAYWLKRLSKLKTLDECLIKLEEAANLFIK
ncbi:MAG: radical SAM protein [Candidatus Omnitrophota bacterium]